MVEPATHRRRKTSNGAADQIVVALEQLLAREHIDTITVNDIMRSAGVARGTFYFWFTSKYDVVAHAHRTVTAEILAATAPWFGPPLALRRKCPGRARPGGRDYPRLLRAHRAED